MCVNQGNTSETDVEAVEALIETLGEGSALGAFLTAITSVVRQGGSICLGIEGQQPPQPPPAAASGPAPGIYPPQAFQPQPQPVDLDDKGYGNYL